MDRPNVVFCNLQNSGSSAIDPILREIFARSGYFMPPYGPEGTERLRPELARGEVATPFYHWTHDPVETFAGMVGDPAYRFIYLHRDPRDAAVSWAHDFQRSGVCGDMTFSKILEMVVTHNQPPHVRSAVNWVKADCMVITFRQVKENTSAVVRAILEFVGYFETTDVIPLSDSEIEETVAKYSFEALAGRKRGEYGEISRSSYMLRKGISGEWKKQFSPELVRKCNEIMGREILALGYEITSPHGDAEAETVVQPASVRAIVSASFNAAQIVSPPFSCGVAWLINALLYLNIRVTNTSFEPNHWQSKDDAWRLSESAETHLKWHLPVLHERQFFRFAEALEVRWEHRLDFAADDMCPTILFVRDPRDAVHSLYKRNYAEDMSFVGYLNRPDEWPHHFPGLFQMPPLESFTYFCWYWLAMGEVMPVKLIRFEDVKSAPVRVLREVLQYLGVERSEAQINAAVESSSFEQALRAMEKMEAATGKVFKTVRKAQVGEWRSSYSMLELASVRELTKTLIRHLGYAGGCGIAPGNRMLGDYREQVGRCIAAALREIVTSWLLATEEGRPPGAAEIAAEVQKREIDGKDLLRLATIAEAIYYVRQIFTDTASTQARIALNVFVNLNLSFFDHWPVQVAAWYGLRRIEEESGVPTIERLGHYHDCRMKIYNRLWKML